MPRTTSKSSASGYGRTSTTTPIQPQATASSHPTPPIHELEPMELDDPMGRKKTPDDPAAAQPDYEFWCFLEGGRRPFRVTVPANTDGEELRNAIWQVNKGKFELQRIDANDLDVFKVNKNVPVDPDDTHPGPISSEFRDPSSMTILKVGQKLSEVFKERLDARYIHLYITLSCVEDESGGNEEFGNLRSLNKSIEPYRVVFLRSTQTNCFHESDIELNDIEGNTGLMIVPEFVTKYEEMLQKKRKFHKSALMSTQYFLGSVNSSDYFDDAGDFPDPSTAKVTLDTLEGAHLVHIQHVVWDFVEGNKRPFKEHDANFLFFRSIAHYCKKRTLLLNDALTVATKLNEQWPFRFIVEVHDKYYTYNPRSDVLILTRHLPRLAVEVNSNSPDKEPLDRYRMLIQAASMVRFANTFLDAYKEKKDFIFIAIYIDDVGNARRYLLFQNGSSKVHYKLKSFALAHENERLAFALELYNLCSQSSVHSGEKIRSQMNTYNEAVDSYGKKHHWRTFTGSNKRSATDAGGGDPGPSTRQKGNDGGTVRDLGAHGFEVVSHSFEAEGGTWELLFKPPPHILTVYRRTDPSKTELIAKYIRKGSNELEILEYLHARHPPHVISLIESFHAQSGSWAILPELHSIRNQLDFNYCSRLRGKAVQLCWGLIEGLAYLHGHLIAHMDIKPDNLLYDDAYQLQIADFDAAIRVEDENVETVGYRGTEGWTAPEVGARDGPASMYSPIKADRWSCGHVLLYLLDRIGEEDGRLRAVAGKLKARTPKQRPSLLDLHKWLPASLSDVTNTSKDGGNDMFQPRQVTPRIDEAPNAKKARLADAVPMVVQAVTSSISQSTLSGSTAELVSALKCLGTWMPNLPGNEITTIIPLLISRLGPVSSLSPTPDFDDNVFVSVSDTLEEVMAKSALADGSGAKTLTEPLLFWLDKWAGTIIEHTLKSGHADQTSHALCKLLVSLGDHSTSYLASNISSPSLVSAPTYMASFISAGAQATKGHLVQSFLKFLLSYTALPGYYGIDEEESEMTLWFWYLFQEALWNTNYYFEEGEDGVTLGRPDVEEAQWVVAKAVYSELVQVLRRKVKWPSKSKLAGWTKDQKEKFRCYRRDVGDTLINAYYILRGDMLGYYVNDISERLSIIQDHIEWEEVEATLHRFMSIQEAIPVEDNCHLTRLFSSEILDRLPKAGHERVRRTILGVIGTYASWFTTHAADSSTPSLLMNAVSYVVTALSEPSLCLEATNALRDLCDANREALAPHINAFSEVHAGLTSIPDTERSKVLQSIASVIQALPPDEEIAPIEAIVRPVVASLADALHFFQHSSQTRLVT